MHFAASNVLMHNFYKINLNVLNYITQPTCCFLQILHCLQYCIISLQELLTQSN